MRVPSIATIVGNDVKRYLFSPEKVGVCRSALENADVVVGLSRDLVEMADALSPIEHKAHIVYNSVQLTEPPWAPHHASPFRIGCAGIFKYAKGLPYLFKAASAVASKHDVAVELVGTVRESEIHVYDTMMERTALQGVVHVREPVPHDGISEWLRTLDLFVLPSVTEGCPNILMEALAAGVPCIATRTGAAEVLVEDGVSGLLVPWGDSVALTDAIMRVIVHPRLAESMGKKAREQMERFSPEIERKAWQKVYDGLS